LQRCDYSNRIGWY